jgi:DNA-binding MarR family transcriptional regulator
VQIIIPPPTETASRLRLGITRTARRLRQESRVGLTPSQTAALATIERHGPITPSELAQRERVQRPTLTRVLAVLEDAGLIERATDPADRRSCLVTVSGPGAELLAASRGRKDAFLASRLLALPPEDVAVLDRAATLLEELLEDGE